MPVVNRVFKTSADGICRGLSLLSPGRPCEAESFWCEQKTALYRLAVNVGSSLVHNGVDDAIAAREYMLDIPSIAYLLTFVECPPKGAVVPSVVAISHQIVVIGYGIDNALRCRLQR